MKCFTDNYGFIVDYLAEVLKEPAGRQNEWLHPIFWIIGFHHHPWQDVHAKTFSGLIKVIYPHGEFSEEEANTSLNLPLKNRKKGERPAPQNGRNLWAGCIFLTSARNPEREAILQWRCRRWYYRKQRATGSGRCEPNAWGGWTITQNQASKTSRWAEGRQKIIRDNQSGISYDILFGDLPCRGKANQHQQTHTYGCHTELRNFMELP